MTVIIIFTICASLFILYMVYRAHHDIVTYEVAYMKNLPNRFHGYRIFFIADVHRRKIKEKTLQKIEDPIDAVFLGGDMIEGFVPFKRLEKNLQLLSKWSVPIYFVAGNNDYEKNKEQLHYLLAQYHVHVLEDEVVSLQREEASIQIVGFPYMYDETLRVFDISSLGNKINILLMHSPYTYEYLSDSAGQLFTLGLAGHTHGGQIRIFSYGPYRPGGWRRKGNTALFITEGYGYSLLPFRLGTQAQCHVITLLRN